MKTLAQLPANMQVTRQKESVIKFLVASATNHGFTPLKVDEGEEIIRVSTVDDVLDVVFSVYHSKIYFVNGQGVRHTVEVDLSQDAWGIIVDSSQGSAWDEVMEEIDGFCLAMPQPRPELTHRETILLRELQKLQGWCISHLEPAMSGRAPYPNLVRDLRTASLAVLEATGTTSHEVHLDRGR